MSSDPLDDPHPDYAHHSPVPSSRYRLAPEYGGSAVDDSAEEGDQETTADHTPSVGRRSRERMRNLSSLSPVMAGIPPSVYEARERRDELASRHWERKQRQWRTDMQKTHQFAAEKEAAEFVEESFRDILKGVPAKFRSHALPPPAYTRPNLSPTGSLSPTAARLGTLRESHGADRFWDDRLSTRASRTIQTLSPLLKTRPRQESDVAGDPNLSAECVEAEQGTPGAAGTPMSGNRSVLDELRRLRQSKTEQDAKLVKVQNALEREREANKSLQKALQLVENQQRSRMLMRRDDSWGSVNMLTRSDGPLEPRNLGRPNTSQGLPLSTPNTSAPLPPAPLARSLHEVVASVCGGPSKGTLGRAPASLNPEEEDEVYDVGQILSANVMDRQTTMPRPSSVLGYMKSWQKRSGVSGGKSGKRGRSTSPSKAERSRNLILISNREEFEKHKNELDSIYKDVQREIKRAGKHVDELEGDTEAEIATRWSMGRPQFGLTRSMFTTAAEFRLALLKEEKKQLKTRSNDMLIRNLGQMISEIKDFQLIVRNRSPDSDVHSMILKIVRKIEDLAMVLQHRIQQNPYKNPFQPKGLDPSLLDSQDATAPPKERAEWKSADGASFAMQEFFHLAFQVVQLLDGSDGANPERVNVLADLVVQNLKLVSRSLGPPDGGAMPLSVGASDHLQISESIGESDSAGGSNAPETGGSRRARISPHEEFEFSPAGDMDLEFLSTNTRSILLSILSNLHGEMRASHLREKEVQEKLRHSELEVMHLRDELQFLQADFDRARRHGGLREHVDKDTSTTHALVDRSEWCDDGLPGLATTKSVWTLTYLPQPQQITAVAVSAYTEAPASSEEAERFMEELEEQERRMELEESRRLQKLRETGEETSQALGEFSSIGRGGLQGSLVKIPTITHTTLQAVIQATTPEQRFVLAHVLGRFQGTVSAETLKLSVRSLPWIMRRIASVYQQWIAWREHEIAISQSMSTALGETGNEKVWTPSEPMAIFVVQGFLNDYGIPKLAVNHVLDFVATIDILKEFSHRVTLFMHFFYNKFSSQCLSRVMDFLEALMLVGVSMQGTDTTIRFSTAKEALLSPKAFGSNEDRQFVSTLLQSLQDTYIGASETESPAASGEAPSTTYQDPDPDIYLDELLLMVAEFWMAFQRKSSDSGAEEADAHAVEIPARIFEESSQDELFWYIRLMVSSYVDGRIAAQVLKIKEELRAQAQEEGGIGHMGGVPSEMELRRQVEFTEQEIRFLVNVINPRINSSKFVEQMRTCLNMIQVQRQTEDKGKVVDEHGSGDEAGQEEDEEEVSALLGRELQHVKVNVLLAYLYRILLWIHDSDDQCTVPPVHTIMQIMTRGDPFSDKAVPSASQVIEDRKSLSSGTSASLVDGPEEEDVQGGLGVLDEEGMYRSESGSLYDHGSEDGSLGMDGADPNED